MAIDPSQQTTKITVLGIFKPEEVFREDPKATANYSDQPCPVFHEGQEMLSQGAWPSKPESFYEAAWAAIKPYLMTIHCVGSFLKWIKKPGVAVVSCPDGFRPVVFKLERISAGN